MLAAFRFQLEAACVSSHTKELWYKETVCLWMTIYIYISIIFSWCPKTLGVEYSNIVCLFSLFNVTSIFGGYLKAILPEEQYWYYLTHSWEDKGVHTFPKGICPKVNVTAWLEYEFAYYDSPVHRFNHYATKTPTSYIEYMRDFI